MYVNNVSTVSIVSYCLDFILTGSYLKLLLVFIMRVILVFLGKKKSRN